MTPQWLAAGRSVREDLSDAGDVPKTLAAAEQAQF